MTCYIANHQKAKRVFEKQEVKLAHAIKHNFPYEKIVELVGKLRDAKLKIFKAKFSQNSVLPASKWEPDEKAKLWLTKPVNEIIEEYRNKK